MRAVGQNSYARHPLLARMLRDFRQIFAQERLAARNHQARDTQAGKDVNRVAQIIKTRVDSSVAIAVGRVAPNTREVAGIRHMEIGGREVVAPTRFSLFRKPMTSKMSTSSLHPAGTSSMATSRSNIASHSSAPSGVRPTRAPEAVLPIAGMPRISKRTMWEASRIITFHAIGYFVLNIERCVLYARALR